MGTFWSMWQHGQNVRVQHVRVCLSISAWAQHQLSDCRSIIFSMIAISCGWALPSKSTPSAGGGNRIGARDGSMSRARFATASPTCWSISTPDPRAVASSRNRQLRPIPLRSEIERHARLARSRALHPSGASPVAQGFSAHACRLAPRRERAGLRSGRIPDSAVRRGGHRGLAATPAKGACA